MPARSIPFCTEAHESSIDPHVSESEPFRLLTCTLHAEALMVSLAGIVPLHFPSITQLPSGQTQDHDLHSAPSSGAQGVLDEQKVPGTSVTQEVRRCVSWYSAAST